MALILLSEAQGDGVAFWLIAMLLLGCWGFAGRWILFHPNKIFVATVGRTEAIFANLVGTFMVFSGAMGVIFYVALIVHVPWWIGQPVAIACGVYAAIRIRKELHKTTTKADQRA